MLHNKSFKKEATKAGVLDGLYYRRLRFVLPVFTEVDRWVWSISNWFSLTKGS